MKSLGKYILWQRAKDYLRKYRPVVIGVAGSTGKTLAKDAIAAALSDKYRVRYATGSYNTRIGVALSILGINVKTMGKSWFRLLVKSKMKEIDEVEPEVIVLELGADRPGDIDYLAKNISFDVGVVTNVQSAHLRLFTSKELVAHEMQSLVVSVVKAGRVVLNIDDPLVEKMEDKAQVKVVKFGESEGADVRLLRKEGMKSFGFACEVKVAGKIYEMHLPNIIAEYQIVNLLSALAVAEGLGADISKAVQNLQTVKPAPGRMRLLKGNNGSRILDDSYNAAPESMTAAIDLLEEMPAGRRVAILGDMLDLGAKSIGWHREVGKQVAEVADVLVTVGDNMRQTGAVVLEKGGVDVHHFDDSKNVGKWLRDYLHQDDVVLVKGSRDMYMEEVTKRLLADGEGQVSVSTL